MSKYHKRKEKKKHLDIVNYQPDDIHIWHLKNKYIKYRQLHKNHIDIKALEYQKFLQNQLNKSNTGILQPNHEGLELNLLNPNQNTNIFGVNEMSKGNSKGSLKLKNSNSEYFPYKPQSYFLKNKEKNKQNS